MDHLKRENARLREKETPKEPLNVHEELDYEGFDIEVGGCPNCPGEVVKGEHYYCPTVVRAWIGQALKNN